MIAKFIQDIKTKLSIEGGAFVDAEIESYVVALKASQYQDFFNALSGDEFRFYKGIDRVSIVAKRFTPESYHESEARVIATLMHDINKIVLSEAESKGEDYYRLMMALNVRKSFQLTDKKAYVMNEIGGREAIIKINTTEPNTLERKIIESLKRYERDNVGKTLSIASSMSRNLIAELTKEIKQ